MSKKEMINVNINGDNNLAKNNKQVDNSTNINKIISKDKNAKKKNRNILPPQEKPTVKNGGFLNEMETNFDCLRVQPKIKDISFIRPNLEKLYIEGRELEMYAYVDERRKKDGKYTLYNLCSESMFISDHIIVKDPNNELEFKVGQCIKFNGSVYKYDDKYSVNITNINDVGSFTLRKMSYNDSCINDDIIDHVFTSISESEPNRQFDVMKCLCEKLNTYSCQMFGSRKFIMGMIFDFFFMRSRNENLSSNMYLTDLDICKPISIMIISDILFRIENGLIQNFKDLQYRVIQIATMTQGIMNKEVLSSPTFNRFCITFRIDRLYGVQYVKDVYKRYKLKDIINNTNIKTLNYEMRFATACIVLNI